MRYDFEWDPKKARGNVRKHKIGFERATTVFRDRNLLSIPDEEHSQSEERWITIGLDENGVFTRPFAQIYEYGRRKRTDQNYFSQKSY